MSWLTAIISFFSAPVAELVGSYREQKRIAAESAASIANAKTQLKVAKLEAAAERERTQAQNDNDYDLAALNNRRSSYMDEIIVLTFLGLYIAHFVPDLQPYMSSGWAAMGYDGVPWYFEFIIVGISVSTLGLMRLFRAFWPIKKGGK